MYEQQILLNGDLHPWANVLHHGIETVRSRLNGHVKEESTPSKYLKESYHRRTQHVA